MIEKIKLEKTLYFDALAPEWDEVIGNNQERIDRIDQIFDKIDIKKGDNILDAGCGNGVLFEFISKKIGPEGSITAIDSSPAMIDQAKYLRRNIANVFYNVGDVENFIFQESFFDVILCFAVIPHVDDKCNALKNFNKAIKETGRLYIFHLDDTNTLNRFHSTMNGPVKHDILPDEIGIRSMLEDAGFTVITYIDRPGLNFIACNA